MVSFRHSGKIGDVIYSLPVLRACGASVLYLNTPGFFGRGTVDAESLVRLLGTQAYIFEAKVWEGEPFDHDFDAFRRIADAKTNIADSHLLAFGLPVELRDERWLDLAPLQPGTIPPVIFARSLEYPGVPTLWPECYRLFGANAVFVGGQQEHAAFQSTVGPVPFFPTPNLLMLARAVASCQLFVGNQSAPYAIAEGLKVNAVQETCTGIENCLFLRPNALMVETEADVSKIEAFARRHICP